MTVIAMTREMGTRGKDVAEILADRLSSKLVYHELVEEAPERTRTTESSEVRRFLHAGAGEGEAAHAPTDRHGQMTPEEVFEVASRGNVIIRGWGPVRLLRPVPHVLCVRVCAPMEVRVGEMVRRLGVTAEAARREIERSDAAHTSIFARFFGTDWRDALNYDLVLNTAKLAPTECADIIGDAVMSPAFSETEELHRALADRLTEARIAALLRNDPAVKAWARNVYVLVADGKVTLNGIVRTPGAHQEIERVIRDRTGTEAIRNNVQDISRDL